MCVLCINWLIFIGEILTGLLVFMSKEVSKKCLVYGIMLCNVLQQLSWE